MNRGKDAHALTWENLKDFKFLIFLAIVNTSVHIGMQPSGALRYLIAVAMLASGLLLLRIFTHSLRKGYRVSYYFKVIYFLLLVWCVYTILRSLGTNTKDLISLFGHYLMGWTWATPLAMVFGFNIFNWFPIFQFLSKVLLAVSLISITQVVLSEKLCTGLIEGLPFFPILFLSHPFQSRKNKQITFIAIIAFLTLSITISQRANMLYLMFILLCYLIEYLRRKDVRRSMKVPMVLLSLLLVLLSINEVNRTINSILQNDDAQTDTRSFLVIELFKDLSERELYVGKGAMGSYYSPYFRDNEGDAYNRQVNEIGYLHILLKGGGVMILLQLLILLPAAFLGIIASRNCIARMCGYIVLSYLIMWTVSYYPIYSAEYLLLWMAAGTCISPKSRKMTDHELKFYLKGTRVYIQPGFEQKTQYAGRK
ncbi:MAG: hypothetical protein HQL32_11845 [Planctomycetes bacterium]|nr:hypothetical protein [Planctomycetota bacterium]